MLRRASLKPAINPVRKAGRHLLVFSFVILVTAFLLLSHFGWKSSSAWLRRKLHLRSHARTADSVVRELGESVRDRLRDDLQRVGLSWPPSEIWLVGLKAERRLEVWAGTTPDNRRLLKSYPVLAASGTSGPKLREGDRQVPEGIYRISLLNPNSQYHLSLRVSYPNDEDARLAREESRTRLGGDIYVHGSAVSIGCLAIGDTAIEEVFVLAALAKRLPGIVIAPRDFRVRPPEPADLESKPGWMKERYEKIESEMRGYRTQG